MKPGLEQRSQVQWGQTRIDYGIRRSRRRKTVAVAVDPIEGVILTAPEAVPVARLDAIVRAKARWITARLRHLGEAEPPGPAREFVSGESLLYLGRHHRLKVRRERDREAPAAVKLDHGAFVVVVGEHDCGEAVRAALEAWYRQRAEARVAQAVRRWQPIVGVEARAVRIREQAKRWASCDSAGVLRFNWRIIQAPARLVDYVVAHELVHLLHADHTAAFWARLGQVMPDYEDRKEALRRLGPQLWW